jgi:hypothetical protein
MNFQISEKSNTKCRICHLYLHILDNILFFLDFEKLLEVKAVCRRFYQAIHCSLKRISASTNRVINGYNNMNRLEVTTKDMGMEGMDTGHSWVKLRLIDSHGEDKHDIIVATNYN